MTRAAKWKRAAAALLSGRVAAGRVALVAENEPRSSASWTYIGLGRSRASSSVSTIRRVQDADTQIRATGPSAPGRPASRRARPAAVIRTSDPAMVGVRVECQCALIALGLDLAPKAGGPVRPFAGRLDVEAVRPAWPSARPTSSPAGLETADGLAGRASPGSLIPTHIIKVRWPDGWRRACLPRQFVAVVAGRFVAVVAVGYEHGAAGHGGRDLPAITFTSVTGHSRWTTPSSVAASSGIWPATAASSRSWHTFSGSG